MKQRKKQVDEVDSLDKESVILERFRMISFCKIKYVGRPLHCFRVERLIKSIVFSRSWIDSSSKSDPPPDFHNDNHHIMMEFMRIDDSVGGKHSPNSFERTHKFLINYFGADYKQRMKGCKLFFIPNTSSDEEYNFKGYFRNFERVLMDHSNKVSAYHKNYPKCKTCVLFICDESNSYYQPTEINGQKMIHICFSDTKFVEIIKKCKADYVVWFTIYKAILNQKNKEIKMPYACIYDVKHIKEFGHEYNHDKMIKIK